MNTDDGFNANMYKEDLDDLIKDLYYQVSTKRTSIMLLRKYSEILFRKFFNISNDDEFTVGNVLYSIEHMEKNQKGINEKIKQCAKQFSREELNFLIKICKKITEYGNKYIHSSKPEEKNTNEDYEIMKSAIVDLQSFIFIDFFTKNKIDESIDLSVLSMFSLLPSIVRYKTFMFLWENGNHNILVFDKLILAMMKTYNIEKACDWLSEQQNMLEKKYVNENGTYYEYGMKKIDGMRIYFENNEEVFLTFEQVKEKYYECLETFGNKGALGDLQESMSLLYMGRESIN